MFKEKTNKRLMIPLLLMICIYYCGQLLYYDFFKAFMTVYSVGGGTQVLEFKNEIIDLFTRNIAWIIVSFIPFILFLIIKKKLHAVKFTKKQTIAYFCAFVASYVVSYGALYIPTSSTITALDVFKEKSISELSVEKLGLMTSLRLDVEAVLFGKDNNIIIDGDNNELEETVEYNTMNIDFDALINLSNDEKLKSMHQYFKSVTPTKKNDYTGMFEGYNLIVLTCEAFSPYAINKDVTPTLYKLATEGFVFNNFYTPLWNVSTSDGEYVALQGLIPKSGTWSFRDSSDNDLPFVLGQQYKKLGYTTNAYHNHTYTYYNRDQSHPNLGYNYVGIGNGLKIKSQWPRSDLEMMQKTVDEYINEEHFHTYYMTVSGHTNYTWIGNSMASKNKSLVKDLNYSELAKGYLATQKELDKAMEYLLQRLVETGKDKNTVIVMSADHYPYGLPYENYSELAGKKLEKNFELYENSFIIWSGSMEEPITVDKLGCSMDILPTVSNLMGLEYDSRLLIGTDLLSDSDPLVIFANKSFMTDKVKYNALTDTAEWLNGHEEDTEYLKNMIQVVKQKFNISTQILDKNYYHYIKTTDEDN